MGIKTDGGALMQWFQRIWIRMTADRKRFGILCAMCVIGLLLWARIIIIAKVPRTAVADDKAQTSQAQTSRAGDSDNKSFGPRKVSLWQTPLRDPFLIRDEYYPRPTNLTSFNTEPGKSGPKHAEDPEQAEARYEKYLRDEVEKLKLEAVMTGNPMAVINGRMYRPGSTVHPPGNKELFFQLVEVSERSVILEFEGRRYTLVMPYPGESEE